MENREERPGEQLRDTRVALRNKLREREGKVLRGSLLNVLGDLDVDTAGMTWLSLEASDALITDWQDKLSLPPDAPLMLTPPESETFRTSWQIGQGAPVQASRLPDRCLILFGAYIEMGIAEASTRFVTDHMEELAVADSNGFSAVARDLSSVLQVDLEEKPDAQLIEFAAWGDVAFEKR